MKPSSEVTDWSVFYLKGRPVWGPHLYDLETYAELRNETLKYLEEFQQDGGLLLLPFDESAERAVLIFLNLLAGKLLEQGKRPFYSHFLGEPYLETPEQSADIWIIHNAPRFKNIFDIMETWVKPGKVLLATGMTEMWERYLPRISFLSLPYFLEKAKGFDTEETRLQEETTRQIETHDLTRAYHLVALCDAWGVPLPFDLLARLLNTDGDTLAPVIEEAYQKGILFWVEREKPWALLVATRSERHARRYLEHLPERQRSEAIKIYHSMFQIINAEDREERFTILKLLESWLTHSQHRKKIFEGKFGINEIRNFVEDSWNCIKLIIRAGNNSEQLLWAQCLAQMGLYPKGFDILNQGLRIAPKNAYLLQSKAHLLSQWSNVDPRKQEEASRAFSRAVKVISDNPYLWQAWGVFEAERGNRDAAERYFNNSLQIDPRNLCTLVARADMNLGAGFFDKVSDDLNKAKQINDRNLYVQHLEGRLFFYLGKWADANRVWMGILNSQKQNLYALHSLGHMARERGQWDEARLHLEVALRSDPENVPVLQERGFLEYEMENGSLEESENLLLEALSIEPGNPKTIVSLAVVERKKGKLDAAMDRLKILIQIWPNNVYALHTLALCFLDKEQEETALQYLQQIINLSGGRNLLPYFTLTEMAIKHSEFEKAYDFLRQAIGAYEIQKNFLPVHKKIAALLEKARLLHRLVRWNQQVESILNEAMRFDPDNKKTQNLILAMRG